jgi:mycofactocin system transcriptional regulator
MPRTTAARKAPQQTSTEAIEKVALELFATRGFEETPIEDIAAAAGISRRSFFRYFPSKNDIPFGDNESLLHDLDQWLSSVPDDRPPFEVIADATVRFNRLHTDGPVAHRERMELILHTPALRANATLVHAHWRAVVARYAARRMGVPADGLGPQLAGYMAHGASTAAYEQWLRDKSSDLSELIHEAFRLVQDLPQLEATNWRPPRRRRSNVAPPEPVPTITG